MNCTPHLDFYFIILIYKVNLIKYLVCTAVTLNFMHQYKDGLLYASVLLHVACMSHLSYILCLKYNIYLPISAFNSI